MHISQLHDAMNFAHRLADGSRSIIGSAFRHGCQFSNKADGSPVTEIDMKVEQSLRQAIHEQYPAHGVLGEEYAPEDADADYVWVIDPIDGTKDFIAGIPTFGTLIALAYKGVPILGVIDLPMTKERWSGADGIPTVWNGQPVRVRTGRPLSEALLSTSSPDYFKGEDQESFARLRSSVHWCVYGGGCCAYGRLASGSIDIDIQAGLDPADFCAGAPIIRNAGGVVTDWNGNPLTIHSGKNVLSAGDAPLHDQALDILARTSREVA
jgi:histidinol phosphatase-like enzyme (inositol monophosphatase family)